MDKFTIYFLDQGLPGEPGRVATRVSLLADSPAANFIEGLYGKKSCEVVSMINAELGSLVTNDMLNTRKALQIIEHVAQLYPNTIMQNKKYYARLQLRIPMGASLEDSRPSIIVHTRHPVTGIDMTVNTFQQAAEIYTLLSIQRDPKAQHWLHIAQLLLA